MTAFLQRYLPAGIFWKKVASYFDAAQKIDNTLNTYDGVIVCDKQFFNDFEMEEEV